jgi:hypothetical protein
MSGGVRGRKKDNRPRLGRRAVVASLASLPLLGRAGAAMAAQSRLRLIPSAAAQPAPAFPDGVTILVAGPEGGHTFDWTRVIGPALSRALPPETPVRMTASGGADGVTGANQFDVRSAPDGQTVLLVPGMAALAWLVGDPRAQFDAGHWVPVLAGATPGVVVARVGPSGFGPGAKPRIAASAPGGAELPALLGIDLLGATVVPVFGLSEPGRAAEALQRGAVDAVFVRGRKVPEQVSELAEVGGEPVFTLGARDAAGALVRDPLFPDLPNLVELRAGLGGAPLSGPLFDAWCAAATACQLDFGLVLPQLTPAAMVALWRRAGTQAAAASDVQAAAAALSVRPLGSPAATASIAADAPALLALRRWLATRFNWHAG